MADSETSRSDDQEMTGPTTAGTDSASRWRTGILYILLVAVIWTAASVLKQFIFHKMEFNH
eukprot:GSA25T00013194001.1